MKSTKSSTAFKSAFAAVLSLTLASGGTVLHLSGQPTLTDSQDRIFDSAIAMWTMGATTLFGLLGSRIATNEDSDSV
ncbi:MAG: hypothetical protein AAF773_20565 [Cyanobacteria bacterium P01_D01_bin.115]